MGKQGYTWVFKGVHEYTRVYNVYTRGIQGLIGYSQDIVSSLTLSTNLFWFIIYILRFTHSFFMGNSA